MNREINFRACYDNRMWFVAKFDLWGDPDQRTCDLAPINPKYEELYNILLNEVELMQYTGLKDKNGVEIYEGDIVRHATDEGVYKIIFEDGGFYVKNLFEYDFQTINEYPLEVIGNIYENPELLKEDTNEQIQG